MRRRRPTAAEPVCSADREGRPERRARILGARGANRLRPAITRFRRLDFICAGRHARSLSPSRRLAEDVVSEAWSSSYLAQRPRHQQGRLDLTQARLAFRGDGVARTKLKRLVPAISWSSNGIELASICTVAAAARARRTRPPATAGWAPASQPAPTGVQQHLQSDAGCLEDGMAAAPGYHHLVHRQGMTLEGCPSPAGADPPPDRGASASVAPAGRSSLPLRLRSSAGYSFPSGKFPGVSTSLGSMALSKRRQRWIVGSSDPWASTRTTSRDRSAMA